MLIREISETEFNMFIDRYKKSSIYQTVEYAAVMKQQDYNYMLIGAFKDNVIVAASLLLIKKIKNINYAYAPRGFLIDYNDKPLLYEFTIELKKYLSKLDILAVKITPLIVKQILNSKGEVLVTNKSYELEFNNLKECGYLHLGYNKLFEGFKPRFEAVLDISKDYRILFNNIKREYKTKIRSAEKHGIRIFKANANEINLLYDQVKDKYPRDIKYFEDSYKYFNGKDKMDFYYAKIDTEKYLRLIQDEYKIIETTVNKLNNEILSSKDNSNKLLSHKMDADKKLAEYNSKLVYATNILRDYPDGFVIASALVTKHKGEIFLYMDGYNSQFKSFNAKHLIIWNIIEKYSKLGFKKFNMGGIPDPAIESKYKGLIQFKTNFGSSIIEYAGDFELVVNSFKYTLYKSFNKGTN